MIRLLSRKLVVVIVWGLSLCQALPVWTSDAVNKTTPECTFRQMDENWLIVALVTIFILPSLLLLLIHGLMLRQVVARNNDFVAFHQFRLLSIITGVFMVSWWPVIAFLCATWEANPTLRDSIAVYWAQVIATQKSKSKLLNYKLGNVSSSSTAWQTRSSICWHTTR